MIKLNRVNITIATTALLAFFILLWWVIFHFRLVSPAAVASPLEVLKALPSFLKNEHRPDVLSTMKLSAVAFILSIPIGIISGFLIFFSGPFRPSGMFFLEFIRSIPTTALLPILFLIFGPDNTHRLAAGIISSSLVICLSTTQGLKHRNLTRLGIARFIELTRLQRLLYLNLPEAISQIFIGLRAGVSLALILIVVSEMVIGANVGIGKVINDARNSDAKPEAYGAIIIAGFIGYAYNWLLILAEKKFLHWHNRA